MNAFHSGSHVSGVIMTIAIAAALAACSGIESLSSSSSSSELDAEQQVARMAQSRWDSLIKGDYDTAYASISPATRALISKPDYVRKVGLVKWVTAKVVKVECAVDDLCTVSMEARYEYRNRNVGRVENTQQPKEVWRKKENVWWFVPDGV
jgi:uncharacterized protein YchJ